MAKLCIFQWFYDKSVAGELQLAAEVGDSGKNFIPAEASVTILNEQDSYGKENFTIIQNNCQSLIQT